MYIRIKYKKMAKAFSIVTLSLSFIYLFICGLYISIVQSYRSLSYYSNYTYPNSYSSSYNNYIDYSSYAANKTTEGNIITFLFLAVFIFTSILMLTKVKTVTSKVMSIIGISISGILFLVCILSLTEPRNMSFNEVGAVYLLFTFLALAFSIVYIVHAFKKIRRISNSEELDDLGV